jgi:hypothetical protein
LPKFTAITGGAVGLMVRVSVKLYVFPASRNLPSLGEAVTQALLKLAFSGRVPTLIFESPT